MSLWLWQAQNAVDGTCNAAIDVGQPTSKRMPGWAGGNHLPPVDSQCSVSDVSSVTQDIDERTSGVFILSVKIAHAIQPGLLLRDSGEYEIVLRFDAGIE